MELERYKLLVESVKDYAIFFLDPEGNVLTWNKGAEANKGYKAEEIIGRHFSTFYLKRDIDAGKPNRELELARKHGSVEDEDWRVRKDGSQFWANVVITALYENNKLIGFAKVTRDLTERKSHEDQLRNANISLRKQQRELEYLNNSKDEFISLASHQLRTPATTIKQYLGMILEGIAGSYSPDQLNCVRKAFDSNERQLLIVDNLLKVAQIDAGKVILNKMPNDIGAMTKGIVEDNAEMFETRNQKVIYTPPPEELFALVDITHFRMALDNIVDNASKYTPAGGLIKIDISEKESDIIISVEDNGVGMNKSELALLFKKFSRIPNRLSDSVGGTGLGLYWASKVIELHGGKIEVSSATEKGTNFTMTILKVQNGA